MFGLEVLILKIKKRNTISIHQTVLNLGLGMVERLIGIMTINFGIYFFTALMPWRLFDSIENRWLAFAITFWHQPDCVALIARKASLALFVLALQEPLFTSQ